ncbi:MAG: hypothetical protein RMA76_45100 [Deltaproteobacteria bacterium]
MTDDQQPDPTADECIRAGMYWFGRSDFVAAEAWWQRAVELEPHNQRAHECLRLLQRASSTGFKGPASSSNPFEDPRAHRADPMAGGPQSNPLGVSEPAPLDPYAASEAPTPATGLVAPTIPTPAAQGMSTDPFDFVERGEQLYRTPSSIDSPPASSNPWDEGPSRTSVVTVRSQGDFEAVPEPTPLPELDRDRFFNRGDPQSREEIVDFLRATGDLPADMDPGPLGADIVFDDPVEMPPTPDVPAQQHGPAHQDVPAHQEVPVVQGQAYEPPPQQQSPAALLDAARDRFQLHDFNGALEFLEQIPDDAAEASTAKSLVATARQNLLKMYESKIGDFERTPRVLISGEEVIWLNLNHRAGFILSQIDGAVTYEDLIALSGMPRLDTVRILADLINDRVIG